MQQQKHGSNNYGLWAIAAAYHTAVGDNLGELTLDDEKPSCVVLQQPEAEKIPKVQGH